MRYHRAQLRQNATTSREAKSSMWNELGVLVILVLILSSTVGVVAALSAANDWRKENACPTFCTKSEVYEQRMLKDVEEIERATMEMRHYRAPLPQSRPPSSPDKPRTTEI